MMRIGKFIPLFAAAALFAGDFRMTGGIEAGLLYDSNILDDSLRTRDLLIPISASLGYSWRITDGVINRTSFFPSYTPHIQNRQESAYSHALSTSFEMHPSDTATLIVAAGNDITLYRMMGDRAGWTSNDSVGVSGSISAEFEMNDSMIAALSVRTLAVLYPAADLDSIENILTAKVLCNTSLFSETSVGVFGSITPYTESRLHGYGTNAASVITNEGTRRDIAIGANASYHNEESEWFRFDTALSVSSVWSTGDIAAVILATSYINSGYYNHIAGEISISGTLIAFKGSAVSLALAADVEYYRERFALSSLSTRTGTVIGTATAGLAVEQTLIRNDTLAVGISATADYFRRFSNDPYEESEGFTAGISASLSF
ncbi:MAG: hypothetical protein AABZ39_05945 [Spirochaetota bacterium]